MSGMQPHEELEVKQGKAQGDRFSVHFDYEDLCGRLRILELEQTQIQPQKSSSLKVMMRKVVNLQKQKSIKSSLPHLSDISKPIKMQQSRTLEQLVRPKAKLNRSLTPSKLLKKVGIKKNGLGVSTLELRQSSVPSFAKNWLRPAPKRFNRGNRSMEVGERHE